jgi:nitroreductase
MTEPGQDMTVQDAIYGRRAVRLYKDVAVDKDTIRALLAAAVQAPTAMHEEAWAFTVIQDKAVLRQLSDAGKEIFGHETPGVEPEQKARLKKLTGDPHFNLFYNAGTLVVIWGKPVGPFVIADCWLAAENLMLAACAKGLGSCVIGLSLGALNSPEWKQRLGVPANWSAIAGIILGVPDGQPPPVPRKEPEIVSWL